MAPIPTIRIYHEDVPDGALINESDFDEAIHRRFEDGPAPPPKEARLSALKALKAAQLQALCEDAGLEYRNKDEAILALMAWEFPAAGAE